MQRFRILTTLGLAAMLALMVASCGPDEEVVEPMDWPFLEDTESLTINGKEFAAYIAKTEIHRRRALNGIAITKEQAIAYLYPEQDEPVELKFNNMPDPVELVFVSGKGKVIQVDRVPAFSQSNFPHVYAAENARVVLQLRAGLAKELKLAKGGDAKFKPDLLDESGKAEEPFARLFFLRNERPEDKPEESPSVQLKVLETAEEVSRLMKDRDNMKEGQGVLIPLSGAHHQFWLKECKGSFSACYLASAGRFQGNTIQTIYKNIKAADGPDLQQPVYHSPGDASHLAIWKGGDFFDKHGIERRAPVALAGVDVFSHDEITYDAMEVKFGDAVLECYLAEGDDAREDALLRAPTLKKGKGIVLAWDDPSFVEIDAPAGANLWFVQAEGGNYSIHKKVKTEGGKVDVSARTRFVIAVPEGFEAAGELGFPYVLRDLKPRLPAVVFYEARLKDVVEDRWPTKNRKGLAHVELAVTDAEQRRGLMYRTELKPDHGMLFIYDDEQPSLSYWMKNCKMNLSIAFLSDKGVIVKIHNVMKAPEPGTPDYQLERYESDGPARFAIEMRENWFKDNGISAGDRVFLPPELVKDPQAAQQPRGGMPNITGR